MIFLMSMSLAADPAPLSLEPFMNEEVAARDFEQQMDCLGKQAFSRRTDSRPPKDVAAEVVNACREGARKLRISLADVYHRKPNLLPPGRTAEEAADNYLAEMNGRMELVIREGRKHK